MLKINSQEYSLLSTEIKFVNSTYNGKYHGYCVLIILKFKHNDINGYIDIWFHHSLDNDFTTLTNKVIKSIPTDFNTEISCIEIFDTNNFIDIIDGEVLVEFKNIVNGNLKTKLIIDDELIKVEYEGELKLVY